VVAPALGIEAALKVEAAHKADLPRDVLIVASKLKSYVKARSGLRTSDGVMEALSDLVRLACDEAVRRARADERQTVLDRDVPRGWRPG
jgi:hypothetical protein